MAITEFMDLKFKPEGLGPFKDWARAEFGDTRAWEGCEGMTVHSVLDDPNNLLFIIRWDSKESYQKYVAWRSERGDMAKLASKLADEPVIKLTEIVGV